MCYVSCCWSCWACWACWACCCCCCWWSSHCRIAFDPAVAVISMAAGPECKVEKSILYPHCQVLRKVPPPDFKKKRKRFWGFSHLTSWEPTRYKGLMEGGGLGGVPLGSRDLHPTHFFTYCPSASQVTENPSWQSMKSWLVQRNPYNGYSTIPFPIQPGYL